MKRLFVGTFIVSLMMTNAAFAEHMKHIAFVDTGDTGRAMIAGEIAKTLIQEKNLPIEVIDRAFDLDPYEVTPELNALKLLKEHGIDAIAHRGQQLSAQDVKHSDLILTATAKHKAGVIAAFPQAAAKTFTMAEYATGKTKDVVDAWGKAMPVYQEVYSQIEGYLAPALEKAVKAH